MLSKYFLAVFLCFCLFVCSLTAQEKTELQTAIEKYDWRNFYELFEKHANEKDDLVFNGQYGYLHACVKSGHVEIARLLVNHGANLELKDADGNTPLATYHGSGEGRADVYQILIDAGANINAAGKNGNLPLHAAAKNNSFHAIYLLLKAGADPNAINDEGDTPLHLVAASTNPWAACATELLLHGKADPTIKNQAGKTPLEIAAARDKAPTDLITALKKQKYKLPWDYQKKPLELVEKGSIGRLKLVFLHDPQFARYIDEHGFNMMHVATIRKRLATMKLLAEHKVSLTAPVRAPKNSPSGGASDGKTPLHFAANQGDPTIVKYLLDHRANVNAVDASDFTPLHSACASYFASPEVVKLLLDKKAKLRATKYGMTPMHELMRGSGIVIKHAKSDPKTYRPVQDAENRIEIADQLIKARHPVKGASPNGDTLLHSAAMYGAAPFVKYLLKKKLNPNQPNRSGKTPAQLARDQETADAFKGR